VVFDDAPIIALVSLSYSVFILLRSAIILKEIILANYSTFVPLLPSPKLVLTFVNVFAYLV
jgi:hypothetical protein